MTTKNDSEISFCPTSQVRHADPSTPESKQGTAEALSVASGWAPWGLGSEDRFVSHSDFNINNMIWGSNPPPPPLDAKTMEQVLPIQSYLSARGCLREYAKPIEMDSE
jgi:hypothetical protein